MTKYPLLLSLLFEGSLGILGLLLAYLFQIHPWEQIHWRGSDIYIALLTSLCLFVLFVILYRLPYNFTKDIRTKLEETLGPLFADFGALKIFIVALAAGIGEELLFRAFLQNAFTYLFQDWAALLLSNFFFAMAHWITPFYALFAGLLGLLLGASMLYSQNLLLPILIHTFYDFAALYYFVNRKPKFSVSHVKLKL